MKIDRTVKKETLYIVIGMVIMSAVMEVVFLAIGKWKWNPGVLYSNLLVGVMMVLNFFFLGLTVQKATSYDDERRAQNLMKMSQTLRFLVTVGVVALGALFSDVRDSGPFVFWALIPPLFFNRITIMIRGFTIKNEPSLKLDSAEKDDTEGE